MGNRNPGEQQRLRTRQPDANNGTDQNAPNLNTQGTIFTSAEDDPQRLITLYIDPLREQIAIEKDKIAAYNPDEQAGKYTSTLERRTQARELLDKAGELNMLHRINILGWQPFLHPSLQHIQEQQAEVASQPQKRNDRETKKTKLEGIALEWELALDSADLGQVAESACYLANLNPSATQFRNIHGEAVPLSDLLASAQEENRQWGMYQVSRHMLNRKPLQGTIYAEGYKPHICTPEALLEFGVRGELGIIDTLLVPVLARQMNDIRYVGDLAQALRGELPTVKTKLEDTRNYVRANIPPRLIQRLALPDGVDQVLYQIHNDKRIAAAELLKSPNRPLGIDDRQALEYLRQELAVTNGFWQQLNETRSPNELLMFLTEQAAENDNPAAVAVMRLGFQDNDRATAASDRYLSIERAVRNYPDNVGIILGRRDTTGKPAYQGVVNRLPNAKEITRHMRPLMFGSGTTDSSAVLIQPDNLVTEATMEAIDAVQPPVLTALTTSTHPAEFVSDIFPRAQAAAAYDNQRSSIRVGNRPPASVGEVQAQDYEAYLRTILQLDQTGQTLALADAADDASYLFDEYRVNPEFAIKKLGAIAALSGNLIGKQPLPVALYTAPHIEGMAKRLRDAPLTNLQKEQLALAMLTRFNGALANGGGKNQPERIISDQLYLPISETYDGLMDNIFTLEGLGKATASNTAVITQILDRFDVETPNAQFTRLTDLVVNHLYPQLAVTGPALRTPIEFATNGISLAGLQPIREYYQRLRTRGSDGLPRLTVFTREPQKIKEEWGSHPMFAGTYGAGNVLPGLLKHPADIARVAASKTGEAGAMRRTIELADQQARIRESANPAMGGNTAASVREDVAGNRRATSDEYRAATTQIAAYTGTIQDAVTQLAIAYNQVTGLGHTPNGDNITFTPPDPESHIVADAIESTATLGHADIHIDYPTYRTVTNGLEALLAEQDPRQQRHIAQDLVTISHEVINRLPNRDTVLDTISQDLQL